MQTTSHRVPARVPFPGIAALGVLLLGGASLRAQADWYTTMVVPKARAVHTAVFDVLSSQIVLFGGNTNAGLQGDTWLWSQAAGWSHVHPAASPSPRREHAMAYDLSRGETVLFGGWDGVHLNDTWIWNGSNWRQAAPANHPAPLMGEMAFDPINGNVLLFGGEDGNGVRHNETWSWDGSNWTQLSPATTPPARFDHAMATDWTRSQVVLFGGWDNNFLGDTWLWNGSNWVPGPATGPSARSEHKMAFAGGNVILFGGDSLAGRLQDTWQWNGSAWTLLTPTVSPGVREEHVLVDNIAAGTAVLFGGWHSATGHLADQWTFASGQWTRDTQPQPLGTGTGAMAYDPTARRSILFGGFQDEQVSSQTWAYGNGAWTQLFPPTVPLARAEPALAFDRVRGEFVMFGGANGTAVYGDTWVFRAGNWVQRAPAASPPARWGHAMAFDEGRGTVLLFSGRLANNTNAPDTWEWNGTTWTQLFPATIPIGREDHSLVYDAGHGETVMFGGWAGGFSNETWAFRNGNWVQLSPAHYPPARAEQMMAYDRARQRIVMFAGEAAIGRVNDTWEFTTDWVQRSPLHAPEPREEGVMVFDEQQDEIVMAVGWDLGHFTDTWHFASRPSATAVSYGAGCQGSATSMPVLAANRPWLGSSLTISATGLPANGAALLGFGVLRTNVPLDALGMPGCTLLTQPVNNALVFASGTTASLGLSLPPNPGLLGFRVDLQAFVLAAGANQIGVIASNGVELTVALD